MNEKDILRLGAGLLFFIVGILLLYDAGRPEGQGIFDRRPPQASGKGKKKKIVRKRSGSTDVEQDPTDNFCRDILESCTAQIELRSEDCEENAAKLEVGSMLENPIKNTRCNDIYTKLENGCPEGCVLDRSNLVTLPSDLNFEFDNEEDEFGKCLARGERVVNIKGVCIYP